MTATHLSLPLRVARDGALSACAVGSPAEVAQSVALLLATRVGERRSEPTYGSADGGLLGPLQGAQLDAGAVIRWEPRATAEILDVTFTASAGAP